MWRCRSTFSTMTIASSTTRPTESTMASRVNRLMVKPNTSIKKTAPISEIGMATTGMSTERIEPRNRKMTTTTISRVSVSVLSTSLMASWMYAVAVVGNSNLHPGRQLCLDFRHRGPDLLDDVQRVRGGQDPDSHEGRGLAVEANVLSRSSGRRGRHPQFRRAGRPRRCPASPPVWRNSSAVRRSVLATRLTDTIEPLVLPSAER